MTENEIIFFAIGVLFAIGVIGVLWGVAWAIALAWDIWARRKEVEAK